MGRQAKGVVVRYKRGWAYACFTWERVEYRRALRLRKDRKEDKSKIAEAAARAYSEVVSGQRRAVRRQPGKLLDLAELLEEWIESKRASLDERTVPTIEDYARRYVDYFESLEKITEGSGYDFGMARLGQVLRKTVNRELSYLREFLRWCKAQNVLSATPHIPKLPPKALGTRAGLQRAKAVHITEEQAKAIIALLPLESKKIDGRRWPLRLRFEFMWETSFRPETISRLSVPDHWHRGARSVELQDEDDKARWGREVDLSDRAVEILNEVAPERGLIFGRHVFYKHLKRCARQVLGEAKGKKFAPYDFRHGRARQLLDAGAPKRGVSFMLGHKQDSTTDKYLEADRGTGRAALEVTGGIAGPKADPKKRRKRRES